MIVPGLPEKQSKTAVPGLSRIVSMFVIFLVLFFPDIASSADSSSISGHYRNILIASRTADERDLYSLDSNRLRLELKGEPSDSLSYSIQYDNHLSFGSYISTAEYKTLENTAGGLPQRTYWNMADRVSSGDNLRWDHSIYRAHATLRHRNLDLTVGRQRIPWGKGWFWSPMDMFNPVEPTAIAREERNGVDGVNLEMSSSTANRVSLVYLPQRGAGDTAALRGTTLIGSYDIALSLGAHRGRNFAGADFAGYIGDAGIYGEAVSFEQDDGNSGTSWLLSGNYNFENSTYFMVEYFHNGGGIEHFSGLNFSAKDYAGLQVSYDITVLTRWSNYLILNLSDGSLVFSPGVASSLRENLDLVFGVQIFKGDSGEEYGGGESLYYTEVSWYF